MAWNWDTVRSMVLLGTDQPKKEELQEKQTKAAKIPVIIPQTDLREHNLSSIDFYKSQVSSSRKKPGLYTWGNNTGCVAAPDQPEEKVIKRPKRIPFFDGMVLRDVQLQSEFGAAVTETGDLVQWGKAFSNEAAPEITLKGKDIIKIAVSSDRILALSSNGTVLSLAVSKADQLQGGSVTEHSSWIPYWNSTVGRGARIIRPSLGMTERVIDVKSGVAHCLLLTNKGRLFSAASSSSTFPERGEMGISGLTWQTRPPGPYDQPYEVKLPSDTKIQQIATGDYHSVVLDKKGNVYTFGDNTVAQLARSGAGEDGFEDSPDRVPKVPLASAIAAGGTSTFFAIPSKNKSSGEPVTEIWAAGSGLMGALGTGTRQHINREPTVIKKLAGMTEWNESKRKMTTVKPGRLSAGTTHSSIVLETGEAWPVYLWGSNEYYELGTGKRTIGWEPTQMLPLDSEEKGDYYEYYFAAAPRQKAVVGEDRNSRKIITEQRVD